jgi:Cu(I)/Ag(I) efflux system membrane protein CusA/SilA
LEGTASVYSERVVGGRYIEVDINRDKANRFGMSIKQVQSILATAVGGKVVGQTVEGQERYPINIRYLQDYRNSPEQLAKLPIVTAKGQHIALGDVAEIRITSGPAGIKSENARLNGWTYVDIDGVDVGSYVRMAKAHISKSLSLPAGYSLNWAGQYEYMERAKEKLSFVVPLTLAIIFILLYLNFRQVTDVLVILLTLPVALTGGLWLMYFEGFNLSVAAGVGFIALAGVAVETGVLMLVYLNQARENMREEALQSGNPITEQDYQQALIQGAVQRVRPVIMTVATVILGLLPIMYGTGTGSEVMSRIAAPMVGGMISTIILTLLVLPIIYQFVRKKPDLEDETR